jgi:hypothetical protein
VLDQDTDLQIENRMLHVRVPTKLLEELARRAKAEGEPRTAIVRRALKRELRANQRGR